MLKTKKSDIDFWTFYFTKRIKITFSLIFVFLLYCIWRVLVFWFLYFRGSSLFFWCWTFVCTYQNVSYHSADVDVKRDEDNCLFLIKYWCSSILTESTFAGFKSFVMVVYDLYVVQTLHFWGYILFVVPFSRE